MKTVEEAAKEFAKSVIDSFGRIGVPTGISDIKEMIALGFENGSEWRINSVWHDASERPDKGKLLIVEDIDSAYDLVYLTKSKPWEELSEKNHYMRWAYIEDLLPNMED